MTDSARTKPVAVIVGVGPGNGAAFARRFSAAGHALALIARSTTFSQSLADALPDSKAYACDVSNLEALAQTLSRIERELGPVETLIYNAGAGVWGSIEELTASDFQRSFSISALGAVVAVQQVLPGMKARGRGNIVFIGATASRRGRAKTAAFAAGKAAQRSLAESLARDLGPVGIHVSLLIIDGVIDLPRTRERYPERPDSFFLRPDDIASTVLHVVQQPRSAWTFELDVRPFAESW
jgi:NADP-dependent 3-hydroxy acid dehydrogenase YdfG